MKALLLIIAVLGMLPGMTQALPGVDSDESCRRHV